MIAIIGAGISGLTLAYELQKQNIKYTLFESSGNPGGVMDTFCKDGIVLEQGPNMLMLDEQLMQYISELGIREKIASPLATFKNRYIYKNGEYKKLPSSPIEFLFNDFFSFNTKIAILKEFINKTKSSRNNETLSEFFERRFNKEIVDYIIDPIASGIFAGNTKELLVKKTFPFLLKMEETYGSVLKGFFKNKSASKKESISFSSGMKTLPVAIANKLSSIRYNSKVTSINKTENTFNIHFTSEGEAYSLNADKVVFAAPAWATANMVKEMEPLFANILERIQYVPLVKVFTTFHRKDVKHPMKGYGGLNPSCENQFILASIWNSSIFPDSCPNDQVLITSMVGGGICPQKTGLEDHEIQNKVIEDLKRYYRISSDPVFCSSYKIPHAIPQYNENILPLDAYTIKLEQDGIYICANWKDGAAIGDCMKKAIKLAERLKGE